MNITQRSTEETMREARAWRITPNNDASATVDLLDASGHVVFSATSERFSRRPSTAITRCRTIILNMMSGYQIPDLPIEIEGE